MATRTLTDDEARERRSEIRSLLWGLASALVLTGAAFGAVAWGGLRQADALAVVAGCAVAQIAFQTRFFLHIDLTRQRREDLLLILFTVLLLVIMIGGTIWIMWNLYSRMAPGMLPAVMPPETF